MFGLEYFGFGFEYFQFLGWGLSILGFRERVNSSPSGGEGEAVAALHYQKRHAAALGRRIVKGIVMGTKE